MVYLAITGSWRLSGQLTHQKTGVLAYKTPEAYKTPDYIFSFKAFLTYLFLIEVGTADGTGNDIFSAEIQHNGGSDGDGYNCNASNVVSSLSQTSTLKGLRRSL